jgi:antitoxin YefM
MLSTSLSDFRKDIKKYFDRISDEFETLIINRGKDKGIVIMSLGEYNSLVTTRREISSQINENRLDAALAKFDKGNQVQGVQKSIPSEPSLKLSDKYRGKLPSQVAEELQQYVAESRKEWDSHNI